MTEPFTETHRETLEKLLDEGAVTDNDLPEQKAIRAALAEIDRLRQVEAIQQKAVSTYSTRYEKAVDEIEKRIVALRAALAEIDRLTKCVREQREELRRLYRAGVPLLVQAEKFHE